MATRLMLLSLFIATIYSFSIESHVDTWCEEPMETMDLHSIHLKTNVDFYKEILIHRCGIWLRHIPNKNWTSDLTELFKEPLKSKLRVLKISDGLKTLNQNFFSLESKLKHLDLSGNDLDHLVLPELKYEVPVERQNVLNNLFTLDLSKNKFTNISFVRNNITNLERLDLSWNKLVEVPLDTLFHFVHLKELILTHNNITKFQDSPEYSSLGYLDLSNNHLRNLSGVEKLDNLHTLIVSYNDLQVLETNYSEDVIWSLKDLYLDHNNIIEVNEDAFKYFPNLNILKLNNNLISKLKQGVFSVLKRLESLDVSNNFITSLDAGLFANQKSLIEINLKNNSIKTLDYTYMVHLLPSLKEINVLENHFQCDKFQKMFSFLEENNIFIPGGEVCLGDLNYSKTCCLMEPTKSSPPYLASSDLIKKLTEEVGPVHSKYHRTPNDISLFFSTMERKSDTLLKLSVYQFAFMISIAFLVFILHVSRNCRHRNIDLERKQPELEKIISS